MVIKEMITEDKSLDFETNSPNKYDDKYTESSEEKMYVKWALSRSFVGQSC